MTIEEAIKDLFESKEFKTAQKQNPKLRNDLKRYREGKLQTLAKINLLTGFHYEIKVIKRKKMVIKNAKE